MDSQAKTNPTTEPIEAIPPRFCAGCGSRLSINNQSGYCDLICLTENNQSDEPEYDFYASRSDYDY